MPAKPQWLLQIPQILEQLRAMDVPVVDRGACEKLFGVRRRQAVDLMHRFGGYQSGNAVLLDRGALIIQLQAIGVWLRRRAGAPAEGPPGREDRNSASLPSRGGGADPGCASSDR